MTHEAVPRLTFHILLEGQFSGHKDEDVTFKTFFYKKHPSAKCLNFMSFDDALTLYKESA